MEEESILTDRIFFLLSMTALEKNYLGGEHILLTLFTNTRGQTNKHAHTHINTMTRPDLGAGSSENNN